MILKEDCNKEFEAIVSNINSDVIVNSHLSEIQKCFNIFYSINYITKRIEIKKLFKSDYFIVSYSCLFESFVLLLENYPRGAALVLRSALENNIKHSIEILGNGKYSINDRSYSANKSELDNIIECEVEDKYRALSRRTNAQMLTIYGKLSGLSHSLTIESKTNLINFFSDIRELNSDNVEFVIKYFLLVTEYIYIYSLLLSRESLEKWEREVLDESLALVFGQKRRKRILELFAK